VADISSLACLLEYIDRVGEDKKDDSEIDPPLQSNSIPALHIIAGSLRGAIYHMRATETKDKSFEAKMVNATMAHRDVVSSVLVIFDTKRNDVLDINPDQLYLHLLSASNDTQIKLWRFSLQAKEERLFPISSSSSSELPPVAPSFGRTPSQSRVSVVLSPGQQPPSPLRPALTSPITLLHSFWALHAPVVGMAKSETNARTLWACSKDEIFQWKFHYNRELRPLTYLLPP